MLWVFLPPVYSSTFLVFMGLSTYIELLWPIAAVLLSGLQTLPCNITSSIDSSTWLRPLSRTSSLRSWILSYVLVHSLCSQSAWSLIGPFFPRCKPPRILELPAFLGSVDRYCSCAYASSPGSFPYIALSRIAVFHVAPHEIVCSTLKPTSSSC